MAINPTFAGFLEEEPRAAFFGTLGRQGLLDTPTRRREAQNIYQDALSSFYGRLLKHLLTSYKTFHLQNDLHRWEDSSINQEDTDHELDSYIFRR